MKTKIAALPVALTVHVPVPAPVAAPKANKLSDVDMDILHAAAPLSMPEPKAVKAPKAEVCKPVPAAAPIHAAASLLELVQSMDGSKEARYNVALDGLTAAYSVALTYGNKTQLIAVLNSTGKKACEKGMRQAVQIVGALGYHKDAATRQGAIDSAVASAITIFASIACKETVKRAPVVKAEAAPVAEGAGEGVADAANDAGANTGAGAAPMDIIGYASMLSDDALESLIRSLLDVAAARKQPVLQAA